MRIEGRSAARGPVPAWIERSTTFDIELRQGSSLVVAHSPTLAESDPDQFRQLSLVGGLDPGLTAIDYLAKSLDAALRGNTSEQWAYDRSMLGVLRRELQDVFKEGIDSLELPDQETGVYVSISRSDLPRLSSIERGIPSPQVVRVAGKLDSIRHSDVTFVLFVGEQLEALRGVIDRQHAERLKKLWGSDVVIEGTAHFTRDGAVQLIEADAIHPVSADKMSLWATPPRPLEGGESVAAFQHELRVSQGPRTGINAVFGGWPGNESDEEVAKAVEALS